MAKRFILEKKGCARWFGCYEFNRETFEQYLDGRDWVVMGNYLVAA